MLFKNFPFHFFPTWASSRGAFAPKKRFVRMIKLASKPCWFQNLAPIKNLVPKKYQSVKDIITTSFSQYFVSPMISFISLEFPKKISVIVRSVCFLSWVDCSLSYFDIYDLAQLFTLCFTKV